MLLQTLNSTIVANALPAIGDSMQIDVADLNVLITCYLLASAAFLPISSWLADRFGSRSVFTAAIIAYMVSSILCGLAQNLSQLIGARILGGVAAALMTPVGRIILLRCIPRSQVVRAMSYVTMPSMLGPMLGPPLGGFIVSYWSWRWVFFINIPIAILAAILVSMYIPRDPPQRSAKLDIMGSTLAGAGLAVTVFGLQSLAISNISAGIAFTAALAGTLALAAFSFHARRHPEPALDFSILANRNYLAGTIGGIFPRLLIGAMPFLLALQFQVGFGMSAFSSGLLTFTSAIAAILMKTTSTPIIHRFGFRSVLIVNGFLVAATFAAVSLVTEATPYALIIAILFTGGFFRSLQFTALNAVIYVDLPSADINKGATLVAMTQPLAQSLGISLAAAVVQSASAGSESGTSATSIAIAFSVMAILSLISLPFYWLLKVMPDRGSAE